MPITLTKMIGKSKWPQPVRNYRNSRAEGQTIQSKHVLLNTCNQLNCKNKGSDIWGLLSQNVQNTITKNVAISLAGKPGTNHSRCVL
jgi:hypothetical protein